MMQDNITTPQFLENQRKEKAQKERMEMLSLVSKTAEDLFDDLLPPPLKETESILPSSVQNEDSNTNTSNSSNGIEDKENLTALVKGVGGFISKIGNNIKSLVGLPSPRGKKSSFSSPESKPFSINWNSTNKSRTRTPMKDSSNCSSIV